MTIVLQKLGAVAALYMAAAYALGLVLFLVVLDYPHMTDAAQRIAMLADKQTIIFAANLILYVFFGVALVVFTAALHDRLKGEAPSVVRIAGALGIIWAGSLVASGMVANAGMSPVLQLYGQDPAQAANAWTMIEAIAGGLGNGNGEILGGLMTLLFSWAGLQSNTLPKYLNYLGIVVGLVGVVSLIPSLNDLAGLFGLAQIPWFVILAVVLLRQPNGASA